MKRLIDTIVPRLPGAVRRAARRKLIDPIVTHFTGLLPLRAATAEDIFICGYPKSGNTWFQYLVSAVVYGASAEFATNTLVNSLVTDVYFRDYFRRYGPRSYFKTHELPRPEYRRIVYLLRDGRDVMVSYYHF